MKVFVGSNIFLDYYLDRSNHIKHLGEMAFQFIKRARECEFEIVICERVLDELKRALNKNRQELESIVLKELISSGKLFVLLPCP